MSRIGSNNFELNGSIALRDVYRLFSVFAGDEKIFDLTGEDQSDPLRRMRDEFFVDDIVHLLIGTATANRIHLEHSAAIRASSAGATVDVADLVCGTVWPDVIREADSKELSFREACNKIIHAIHIVPNCGHPLENPLTSEVKLRGTRGKEAWVAYLNIPQYVRASALNFRRQL